MLIRNNFVRYSRHVIAYMLCSLLLAVAAGLVSLYLNSQRLLSVQSASMTPTFLAGDALVIEHVAANQLKVGDIVSYRSGNDGAVVVSHRLTDISKRTGLLTTAGDRLNQSDQPFQPSRVIGRAVAVAPRLGAVMDAVRTPIGLGLLLYLPATAVILSEIWRLARLYSQPFYRYRGAYNKQC